MTRINTVLCFSLVALGVCSAAYAEEEKNPLTARAVFYPSSVEAGGHAELVIAMSLPDGYHAYLDRFKLAIERPDDLKLDSFRLAPVVRFMDTVSRTDKKGIKGTSTMRALVEVPTTFLAGDVIVRLNLTYQACTKEFCLFPKTIQLQAPLSIRPNMDLLATKEYPAESLDASAPSAPSIAPSPSPSPSPAVTIAGNPGFAARVSETSGLGRSDFTKVLDQGLWATLAFLFAVGFATSLTPCVYPMIPITLAVIGTRKERSKRKNLALSLVYVLGIALTYSVLGVLAASTGALFGAALGNIWVVSALALVFIVMGLSMYGAFEIQPPAFIRDRLGGGKTGAGYSGAFLSGLIAGVVASPCVGPVLIGVLAHTARTQNMLHGFIFLFVFALGLGVPFIVLGASSFLLSHLPKSGPWLDGVRFVFGTLMIGVALYYIYPVYEAWLFRVILGLALIGIASVYGAFEANVTLTTVRKRLQKGLMLLILLLGLTLAIAGLLPKAGFDLATTTFTLNPADERPAPTAVRLNWRPFEETTLKAALASGKPVLIDFHADWCVACVELERFTFSDSRVRELGQDFALLKVDATEDFPGLSELRRRYEILGLPTLIFYDRNGTLRNDLTLTGFENAEAFIERMRFANLKSANRRQEGFRLPKAKTSENRLQESHPSL